MSILTDKDSNGRVFINSENITVYPCAYRGQKYESSVLKETYDPEAKLFSEKNITHLSSNSTYGKHDNTDSFIYEDCVVSDTETECKLEFSIAGYRFHINGLTKTDLKTYRFAEIKIKTVQVSTQYSTSLDTTILKSLKDENTTTDILDADGVFYGLALVESKDNSEDATHAYLRLSDTDGNIYQPSYRPKLNHGNADGAIAEGTSTYAIGENTHAEGIGTKAVLTLPEIDNVTNYQITFKTGFTLAQVGNILCQNTTYFKITDISDNNLVVTLDKTGFLDSQTTYLISGVAYGDEAHAEGDLTTASGTASHAEGYQTKAIETYSHAEGYNTTAAMAYSHAEGNGTRATKIAAHAEGTSTVSSGAESHAEGSQTTASGIASHAEGYNTTASGAYSHAEGTSTSASAQNSHASGTGTTADAISETAIGRYNKIGITTENLLFAIGDGTSNTNRHDIVRVIGNTYAGNTFSGGKVLITGSTAGTEENGTLQVTGGISTSMGNFLGGDTSVNGDLIVGSHANNKSLTVNGTVAISGTTTLNDDITIASNKTLRLGSNETTTDNAIISYTDSTIGFDKKISITDSTAGTSDTGALKVTGGISSGGTNYLGGNTTISGDLSLTSNNTIYTDNLIATTQTISGKDVKLLNIGSTTENVDCTTNIIGNNINVGNNSSSTVTIGVNNTKNSYLLISSDPKLHFINGTTKSFITIGNDSIFANNAQIYSTSYIAAPTFYNNTADTTKSTFSVNEDGDINAQSLTLPTWPTITNGITTYTASLPSYASGGSAGDYIDVTYIKTITYLGSDSNPKRLIQIYGKGIGTLVEDYQVKIPITLDYAFTPSDSTESYTKGVYALNVTPYCSTYSGYTTSYLCAHSAYVEGNAEVDLYIGCDTGTNTNGFFFSAILMG